MFINATAIIGQQLPINQSNELQNTVISSFNLEGKTESPTQQKQFWGERKKTLVWHTIHKQFLNQPSRMYQHTCLASTDVESECLAHRNKHSQIHKLQHYYLHLFAHQRYLPGQGRRDPEQSCLSTDRLNRKTPSQQHSYFGCTKQHEGSQLPEQGSNLCPLQGKQSSNHQIIRKVPRADFFGG